MQARVMKCLAVDLSSLQPLSEPGIGGWDQSSRPLVTGLVPRHAAPSLSWTGAAQSHLPA